MFHQILELDLSGQQLTHISEPIRSLSPQLQILRWHSNGLIHLPSFLGEFTSLRMLDLHGNQIQNFHEPWICHFVSLHYLDLSHNSLSFFSPYFALLPHLQLVLLHQNPWQLHQKEYISNLTHSYSDQLFSSLRHSLTSLVSFNTSDSAIALHSSFHPPVVFFRYHCHVFPLTLPLNEQYTSEFKSFMKLLRHEIEWHSINTKDSAMNPKTTMESSYDITRAKIIDELLTTEDTYIRQLEYVIQNYKMPLLANKLLSRTDIELVFSNIDSILAFHRTLYHFMQAGKHQLGSVILKHLDYLKIYTGFINGFDAAMAILEKHTKRKKKFAAFLETRRRLLDHQQVNLQAYILLPIQRIPRYQLLLSQLLKFTSPNHPDYTALVLAVRGIQQKANELNEAKRDHENYIELLKLTDRLSTPFVLLAPHRKLWRQGSLFLWKCKEKSSEIQIHLWFNFALFNDMLVQFKKPNTLLSQLKPNPRPYSVLTSSSLTHVPAFPNCRNSTTSTTASQTTYSFLDWFQQAKTYTRKYQFIRAYSFLPHSPSVYLDSDADVLMVQCMDTILYFQARGRDLNAWWADFQRILLK